MNALILIFALGCSSDPKVALGEEITPGSGAPGDIDGDGSPTEEDCDDNEALVYPGAEEVPYDGLDNDCDPATLDDDLDQDGFPIETDCNDDDPEINPGIEETPYDGIDNDCNAQTADDDLDQDGFNAEEDCDDNDEATNPDAPESTCDEKDNDCDGLVDEDWNGDNYEPNNGVFTAYDAGELDNDEQLSFSGYIQYPGDIDSFAFYVHDGFGFDFGFTAQLDTPSSQDLALEITKLDDSMTSYETLGQANDGGMGGSESYEQGGGFGSDSGIYVVSVFSVNGISCSRYFTLTITEDG